MIYLEKRMMGGANGLRTITCVMLFGVFLGGANSHVKASDSRAVTAHQKITKNATTLGSSTQSNKAQLDVSKLVGADPGDLALTKDSISHRINPNTKYARKTTFLLLNVATEKFFNIGGAYGRHASLNNTGMYLWIWNDSKTPETYNIRTRLNYVNGSKTVTENLDNADSYVQYIDNDSHMSGIYPDCQPSDANRKFGWKFVKAVGYSETNKVYTISTYGDRYLTATPDDKDGNLCKAEASSNSDNQVWKLVTLQEYYDLFKNSPSDLNSPIDITFLLKNPGFGYNKSNAAFWAPSGDAHDFRLGVEDYYKKTTEDYYKRLINDKEERIDEYNEYLYENGKYFCADIKNQHKYKVSQSINVTQPGWYIIRCNGFSNTNFANLFISDLLYFYGFTTDEKYKNTVRLKQLSTNGPKDLLEAGKKFYNGEYENEVRIYISQEDIDYLENYELQEAIYFGIELEGDDNPDPQNEWTAFDNFRLLYAGESEGAPDLVLDEDNPDLKYLTETIDEYKNCNLHLKRSFELNKWNTLILPVDLTYGQMKEAFGNEVKLAELYKLTPNSVRFKTVECNNDDDVMLEAYTPYIIKPTKAAGQNPDYTTPRLLKAENQYWLDENVGITYTEEDVARYTGGKVSIKANHYDIPNVTLDRNLLKANLDKHWVSTTTTSTTAPDADNKMVCKGTMAKTFYIKDNKGYFYKDDNEDRDKLSGDYFMNKGTMYKVPTKNQYGLKAFRCWFELTKTTDESINSTSPAKDVKLFINEIEDETTGIGDIITDPAFSHAAYQYDGVYNLQGQLVRQGTSLEGLPQGIYVVKGKKVKKAF